MTPSISWIGVVLAAISAMVVGSIWYSPGVLLNPWMKMTGTSREEMRKRFPMGMVVMFIAALLTAYILAHFMVYAKLANGTTGIVTGIETALWAWLGLSLTTIITSSALENRDVKVMYITAGNRLVTLLVMGIILGFFM